MRRVAFAELQGRIELVLLALGVAPQRAALGASADGRDGSRWRARRMAVARLPRFAQWVRSGLIDPRAGPEKVAGFGAIERWTGRRGPGNLAAYSAMQRAMELAREHGLGCVALADTSHWMRAGTYGWQAADAGFAAMCWTNTLPNLPPWGASTAALGNNPLVVAIPRRVISSGGGEGESAPIVLDMAMSQFSYGTLAIVSAARRGAAGAGRVRRDGKLTTDAATIERTQRALPIGYWKGSGLSFVLDVLAAMLTGGLATHDLSPDPAKEVGQSQVFLAIAPASVETIEELSRFAQGASVAQRAIDALHAATPIEPGKPVHYPGEGALRVREESMRLGVAVEDAAWEAFVRLEQDLSLDHSDG